MAVVATSAGVGVKCAVDGGRSCDVKDAHNAGARRGVRLADGGWTGRGGDG
jgi:hypothetical protein